jgi:hypothetical protein
LTVFIMSENFRDPFDGNPGSLLHGKRVIGRLEFDERTYPVVSQMRARFEVFRARVERQFGREPSEEWTYLRSSRRIEAGRELIETVLAKRNPDSPGERLGFPTHGNFQATQDIELLPVNHAGVATQQTSVVALRGRDPMVSERRLGAEGRHSLVPLGATRAFETEHWRPIHRPPTVKRYDGTV